MCTGALVLPDQVWGVACQGLPTVAAIWKRLLAANVFEILLFVHDNVVLSETVGVHPSVHHSIFGCLPNQA